MEYCSVVASEEDIKNARAVVGNCMMAANLKLTDKELDLLTKDIMETSAMMGGSYSETDIQDVCEDYIESNFYPRFLRLHRKELGGPLFRL